MLDKNAENLKYLEEGVQQLPKNLQYLTLNLTYNKFEKNDIQKLKYDC